jgi:subtilase family serine protease
MSIRHLLSGAAALIALCALPATAAAAPGKHGPVGRYHAHVCGAAAAGFARCNADVVTDAQGNPLATSSPSGYWPSDLRSAYVLGTPDLVANPPGSGPTLAIVDAYDDPNAESDLGTYRSTFGLGTCTTGNGCFRKVNQSGTSSSFPRRDGGWGQEISLDVDMASAICPQCKVLLVEASSNRFSDLAKAVDTAAGLGASAISNSYGGGEYLGETTDEAHFNHAGVAITASSGDSGYGVEFPAASRYVTAVGGTTLRSSTNARGWNETAWSGAGSGCSRYVPKPTWQPTAGCANRIVADVAAVADPNTGVAVYDTFRTSGWLVFGGTSVASPVVAGTYAVGPNAGGPNAASTLYASGTSLFDVTSGSNGSCGGSYLCTAGTGFDGPTGNGTPNGTSAF